MKSPSNRCQGPKQLQRSERELAMAAEKGVPSPAQSKAHNALQQQLAAAEEAYLEALAVYEG